MTRNEIEALWKAAAERMRKSRETLELICAVQEDERC
jgi:transcriptional regulator